MREVAEQLEQENADLAGKQESLSALSKSVEALQAMQVDLWGNVTPLLRSPEDRSGGKVQVDLGSSQKIAQIVYGMLVVVFITSSPTGIVGWLRSLRRWAPVRALQDRLGLDAA